MMNEFLKVAAPIVVLAAGILGFSVFGEKKKPDPQEQPEASVQRDDTVPVSLFEDKIDIEFDGVVVPYRQIQVSSEIAGQITFKSEDLRSGRFVTKGTKLLEIDPEYHKLEVDRLTAEKVQSEKLIAEHEGDRQKLLDKLIPNARKQLELEEEELARIEELRKKNVVTASDLVPYERNRLSAEDALANLEKQELQLKNKIAQTEQMVLITAAKLGQAKRELKQSTLYAPIDGLIVEESVEEGSFVQRGTELFLVEDTSQVEISSNLTMDQLGWLLQSPQTSSSGTPANNDESAYQLHDIDVQVAYDLAGEMFDWEGYISRLEGTGVDPRTRTIPCRVTVPEPRLDEKAKSQRGRSLRTLMNGMFVEMKAQVGHARPLLALPEASVRPGNIVCKQTKDGREYVEIDVLHRQGVFVLILDDDNCPLKVGDRIIRSPLSMGLSSSSVSQTPQNTTSKETNSAEVAQP